MRDRSNPDVYILRTADFLHRIGWRERLINTIHITGTAGKGTVATMVAEGLRQSGKQVGVFTSPHCIAPIENIQVGTRYISPASFSGLVEHLKPFIRQAYEQGRYGGPSYFETMLAIALMYFKRMRVQWMVLEAGLGGRYDATNVILHPAIAAITCIGLDHTDILGASLRKIARDKAGIIKRGSAFFTAERRKPLRMLFASICQTQEASFHVVRPRRTALATDAALSRAILRYLGVDERCIQRAIARYRLPCRFEIVSRRPTIILDGAHNVLKVQSVVSELSRLQYRRICLVFALLDDKDAEGIVRLLAPLANTVILTKGSAPGMSGRHWMSTTTCSKLFHRFSRRATIITEKRLRAAFARAITVSAPDDAILVTGSFHLAGELRKRWYPESFILKQRKSF